MSMRMKTALFTAMIGIAAVGFSADEGAPPQDEKVLRFASRSAAFYPDSSFSIERDDRRPTPSGFYRHIEVRRNSASQYLNGVLTFILDEATASLDNSSQTRIQHYISTKLRGNTTVIAVVHRLDMISEYDHILVMKDGKIAESGSYDDLIQKKGTLYELINGSGE